MQSKRRLPRGLVCVIGIFAVCMIAIACLQFSVASSFSARKSLEPRGDRSLRTPELPAKVRQSASSFSLSSPSDSTCKIAPFFSEERIANMITAASGRLWEKDFPYWDRWMNYLSGNEEFHMRDNPNGRDHFTFLAALLDAAPADASKLLVDVGANEGGFTRFAALRGYAAIGFEALARNAVYVRNKLLEHGLYNHAVVVNAAMWSRAGDLFELNDNSGNGQLLGKGYGERSSLTSESNVITSTTLDNVLQHDIYFLKLDVEGCEGRVIAGAQCLLSTSRPSPRVFIFFQRVDVTYEAGMHRVKYVFFEFSAKNMQMVSGNDDEPLDMLDNLSSLGYRLFIADCSHNIQAPAIAALPAHCVSDKRAESLFIAEVVKENWSAVAPFEILNRKALVSALLAHFRSIECCIINILAVKPSETK
jgi:FkbM family methyltransferase